MSVLVSCAGGEGADEGGCGGDCFSGSASGGFMASGGLAATTGGGFGSGGLNGNTGGLTGSGGALLGTGAAMSTGGGASFSCDSLIDKTTYAFDANIPPSQMPPGGLAVEDTPLFVSIGYDDNLSLIHI